MAPIAVGIVGASGETGTSIVNGLLEAGNFKIIALTRPSSMDKPANKALEARGIELRSMDLSTATEPSMLIPALKGIQVLVSSIAPLDQHAQIPLATAANEAGVERFLPCAFVPVIPAGGIHMFRDIKEEVYNHIKQIKLGYTILDVGWWYQLVMPKLPSGRTNSILLRADTEIPGDGNVPSALTDVRDVGRYLAKVIADERTLNKYVLVFNEMWTPNQVYDHVEELFGEKAVRNYVSEKDLRERIASAPEGVAMESLVKKVPAQYEISWGIRGDNQPEYAKYLGYLTSKDLYPDFQGVKFEDYAKEVLEGKASGIYAGRYEDLKKKFVESNKESA